MWEWRDVTKTILVFFLLPTKVRPYVDIETACKNGFSPNIFIARNVFEKQEKSFVVPLGFDKC